MKLLLTGATGLVGSEVLRQALSSPHVQKITVLTRRPLPPSFSSPKLTVHIHSDFTSYPTFLDLAGHTACIWSLGPSSNGMKEKEYTVATYDYPLEFARAVVRAKEETEEPFNFVFVSARAARQDEGKTSLMYGRVKVLYFLAQPNQNIFLFTLFHRDAQKRTCWHSPPPN
ncbi:hypothetical protein BT69DRAFT_1222317 [Atractiella rhizophila]|nr:hypothetical protein BT69DRAFT_1222317 [Atractiella rhizophila]